LRLNIGDAMGKKIGNIRPLFLFDDPPQGGGVELGNKREGLLLIESGVERRRDCVGGSVWA